MAVDDEVRWSRPALGAVLVLFVALAVAAAVDGGSFLLPVDRPVEEFAVEHRTEWLDSTMRTITWFGGGATVLVLGALLAVAAGARRVALGVSIAALTIVRPLLSSSVKALVDRDRPELSPLLDPFGDSFPSGHVLGASVWLVVPVVLSLYVDSAPVRRATTVGAVVIIVLVGVSRIYLGVHWLSDVIGGMLLAVLMLAGFAAGSRWLERQSPA